MRTAVITERSKTVWKRNPVSGHEWPETILLSGFEVSGGLMGRTGHPTLRAAEREKEVRDSINRKFPFVMPRTKREIRKAKKLGLLS